MSVEIDLSDAESPDEALAAGSALALACQAGTAGGDAARKGFFFSLTWL